MKKKIISIFLSLIFVLLFSIYFYNHKNDFEILSEVKITYIPLILLIQLLMIFLGGVFNQIMQTHFNLRISLFENFYISLISTIGNFFTPFRGGIGIRAVYLKKKYKFPYSQFLATLAGYYILVFFINSFIGLMSLVILAMLNYQINISLLLFFVLLSSFLLMAILFPKIIKILIIRISSKVPLQKTSNNFILKFTKKVAGSFKNSLIGWINITQDKKLMIKLVLLSLGSFVACIMLYYFEFKALGISTKIYYISIYSSISSISLLFSITPGSLGIKESFLIAFRKSLGLTSSLILSTAIIERISLFFLLIIATLIIQIIKNAGKIIKQNKSNI